MQARLYLNLGVTKEHMEETDEAISFYETCMNICRKNDIFELHHQSLMAAGLAHFNKKDDSVKALNLFNTALGVAKRIQDKNEKYCETLLAKSQLLIQNGDFQSAKQVLKKAYKLQTPSASDKEAIQKSLKIVHVMCKYEDELVITNSFDYAKRKELFEKLGDGSCKLKNYSKAIDCYLKTLEAGQLNGEDENKLIPIYVSLYQTYIDNRDFEAALDYMKKEYELIKDQPKEASETLLGMGNLLDLAGKDFWEADAIYRKSLAEARKSEDQAMEQNVMKKLVKFCRSRDMISLAEILEQEAEEKGLVLMDASEDTEFSEDITDILDVSLELQLSTDADSTDDEKSKAITVSTRRKRPTIAFKKNAKGETRLHEACINGNYQLAKMLIDQGHALNVRDNAGWLPLHEAANHGHRDLVELLLDNGASSSINDKGGTNCEGITPLFDAASNGNLSVVQLLLDRGAKATVKTDNNETPVDALQRWYADYGHKLSPTEKGFYEEVKQRLAEQCEKVGIDTTPRTLNTASSGYNSGKSRNSQSKRQSLRYNKSISDESDEESAKENEDDVKKSARNEYKNVMKQLKNPHNDQRYVLDDASEAKRKSAHLTVNEVGADDWLEDDVGPSKKRQKIFNEKSLDASRSPINSPVKTIARKPSAVLVDSDSDVEICNHNISDDDIVDAFHVVMNAGGDGALAKPKRRSSTAKPQMRPTSQSSLLDSGFARFMAEEESSVKNSTSGSINLGLNDSYSRPNAAEKQLIIKVQIEDEKIIVPVNKDASIELKICWLIEEAARRYYW